MKIFKPFDRLFSFCKSLFLNGLFTLIPIAATIFFLNFTYGLVVKWLQPLKNVEPGFLQSIPGSELIIVVVLIMFFGAIIKVFVLGPLIYRIEKLIEKIPFIRTIYSSSKIVVDFFNVPDPETSERKVVLVQYPRKGTYTLGFLLELRNNGYQEVIQEHTGDKQEMAKVFIPSSPAPTTGYFLFVPRTEIIETTITFEEAIKAVVSCGLITPESLLSDDTTNQ